MRRLKQLFIPKFVDECARFFKRLLALRRVSLHAAQIQQVKHQQSGIARGHRADAQGAFLTGDAQREIRQPRQRVEVALRDGDDLGAAGAGRSARREAFRASRPE